MRRRLAVVCNLAVPGSGLIVLRREWLGLALAVLFGLLVEVALLGTLVVPAAVPVWITRSCIAGAALVWVSAQWRLVVRLRVTEGAALPEEVRLLRERAAAATEAGSYAEAVDILRLALTLDDEDVESNIQWAELMTAMGRFRHARRAWRRVLPLDRCGQHRRQAMEALAALPNVS